MNFFLIFLGVIVLFFLFRTFQAFGTLRYIKEKTDYYIFELESKYNGRPYDTFFYIRRGSLYMRRQNFILATNDYNNAIKMIDNGSNIINIDNGLTITNCTEIRDDLIVNLSYCNKPLPWSKNGPKDMTNNALAFVLIKILGKGRRIFN